MEGGRIGVLASTGPARELYKWEREERVANRDDAASRDETEEARPPKLIPNKLLAICLAVRVELGRCMDMITRQCSPTRRVMGPLSARALNVL